MVQILPEIPSFSANIAKNLGAGISSGLDVGAKLAASALEQRMKQKEKLRTLSEIENSRNFKQKNLDEDVSNPIDQSLDSLLPKDSQDSSRNDSNSYEDALNKSKTAAALGEHDLARTYADEAKILQKQQMSIQDKEDKRYSPRFQEADLERGALPKRKMAMQLFRTANKEGVGAISKSNLAEIGNRLTGDKFNFQPDTAGSMMSYAGKTTLIESLDKVGAKGLNQYLEKQVSQAQPAIGRSEEANNAVLLPMQASLDIDEHFLNTLQSLEQSGQFSQAQAYKKAQKESAKFADERMKQLAVEIQENLESNKSDEQLLDIGYKGNPKNVEKGTPLTERRAILFLKKYGYSEDGDEKKNENAIKTAKSVAKQLGYDID